MKKLLGILVLGLLLVNNAYSNTPTEKFVFDKLYEEYSQCTVYYKFIGRGVEIKGELNENEKLFLDKANKFSEESEKNMFFFAKELNIPNESVQKNIEKIYKSFLEKVGYDYSKTEMLVEYAKNCANSLADPKVRMIYWESKFQQNKKNENLLNIFIFILIAIILFFILKKISKKNMQKAFKKPNIEPKSQINKKNIVPDKMMDNSKKAGKLNQIILEVIRIQLQLTAKGFDYGSKNKDPLKILPKDKFVYGYLYGFVDFCYQTSAIPDEESWLIGSMAFFALIYGPKLGAQICMSSEKLLDTNQKFKEGVKAGSDDARKWKNKESISPLKLSDYINKKK